MHQIYRRLFLLIALTLLAALALSATASASADHRTVVIRDDCDPATFNVALAVSNACVGNGQTTFDDFIGQLQANGTAKRWLFSRPDFGLDAGGTLTITNEGGEPHTFTEVAHFGGGCVNALNAILGLTPVPECPAVSVGIPPEVLAIAVRPGQTTTAANLAPGVHLFQCLIHPWMRSVADVRDDD